MFYSEVLLSRKKPLGKVWMVATRSGKVTRKIVNEISLSDAINHILQPDVPLALRLTGILMEGVVKVYAKKVLFLQQDLDELKIRINSALIVKIPCRLTLNKQINSKSEPVEKETIYSTSISIDFNIMDGEFFAMPRGEKEKSASETSISKSFQANRADITLPEPLVDRFILKEDNFIPLGEDIIDENMFPEFNFPLSGNESNERQGNGSSERRENASTEGRENVTGSINKDDLPSETIPQTIPSEKDQKDGEKEEETKSSEKEEKEVEMEEERKERKERKKRTKISPILFDETTRISASEFKAWLNDSSDTMGSRVKIQIPSIQNRLDKYFSFPSLSFVLEVDGKLKNVFSKQFQGFRSLDMEAVNSNIHSANAEGREQVEMEDLIHGVSDNHPPSMERMRTEHENLRHGTPSSNSNASIPNVNIHFSNSSESQKRKSLSMSLQEETFRSSESLERSSKMNKLSPDLFGKGSIPFPINDDMVMMQGISPNMHFETNVAMQFQSNSERMSSDSLIFHFKNDLESMHSPIISFHEITKNYNKREAARAFLDLCGMAAKQFVVVNQKNPYQDILISRCKT